MSSPVGYREEKAFDQRRAGLVPRDDAADTQYLDALIFVAVDSSGAPGASRSLSYDERQEVLDGHKQHVEHGLVLLPSELAALQARHTARAHGRNTTKAAKLRADARRLEADAARWLTPSS